MSSVSLGSGTLPGLTATEIRGAFGRRLHAVLTFIKTHPVILATLLVTSVFRAWNFTGTPATWNDDEGTYVAQAYAVLHYGALAHYTYWYDHPPLGWLQIAGWAWVTDGFARYAGTAIMIGRELVLIYGVVSGALLYVLCRKLGIRPVFGGVAVVLFMVSPISLFYGKMVFLDNLMLPWLLASLIFAVMAGKRMLMVIPSGICFGMAFLTKETVLPFVLALVALILVYSGKGFRLRNAVYAAFVIGGVGIGSYVTYAAIKGELFEGSGHVSLESAIRWQLLTRADSGPVLASNSTFMSWLALDPYLLFAGIAATVFCLFRIRFIPIAVLSLIGAGLIARGGYLPSPFVIVLLPIAALAVAGALQVILETARTSRLLKIGTVILTVPTIAASVYLAGPLWLERASATLRDDGVASERQAIDWITANSPQGDKARFVVDEIIWMDLINRGYARDSVDWFYKIDADPAVTKRYIPHGGSAEDTWKAVDYVVIPDIGNQIITSVPTLKTAIAHSTVVKTFGGTNGKGFGSYIIYKVNHTQDKGER